MNRLLASIALLAAVSATAETPLSLAGRWRFALDRGDVGIRERWFEKKLADGITLPGSLAAQGIGDDVTTNTPWIGGIVDRSWFTAPEYAKYRQPGNVKVPFWLQPDKYYAGAAWYQRDIEIPADWKAKRVVLFLERAHWETRVWVNNRLVGTNNSLATPHEYDLGQLAPGKHTVSIRVDNRLVIDVGENSHCVSDHTQGNWNGIVGKIELRADSAFCFLGGKMKSQASPVWFERVEVYPEQFPNEIWRLVCRRIRTRIVVGNNTDKPVKGELRLDVGAWQIPSDGRVLTTNLVIPPAGFVGEFSFETRMPLWDGLWDEFSPSFYLIYAEFYGENPEPDLPNYVGIPQLASRRDLFGLRKLATEGTQFTINDRKTFLRGTLDCCIFPKTGHPPMEVEEWKRIIRVAKSFGLNLIRFHSWCPPEAAFQAADELGFYFQVETCWPNQSTTLGDGKPVDQWIYDETDRILKYYGNHPSFLLMAAGNEPGGKNANAWLAKYVAHYKALDPRRLWTSGAGWPQLPENQFHVTPDPRIQSWGGGLRTRINSRPPETTTDYRECIAARNVPCISHEIGQWCVYPNFDEIPKYTGYLKPKNFEIFRDLAEAKGLFGRAGSPLPAVARDAESGAHGVTRPTARDFLLASGKLQVLCYKEEIESALRTPGMGGFQLLDLHDFPGQGTALVGVLDPFWEEKGYVTAKEFSRFCNSTVPLARLKKRVFTTDERLEAEIEVAHFGSWPLEDAKNTWRLVAENGSVAATGTLHAASIPLGSGVPLGSVGVDLKDAQAPARYKLDASIWEEYYQACPPGQTTNRTLVRRTLGENDWDIWVYPPAVDTSVPAGITVANELNDAALAALNAGGKVLLLIPPQRVAPDKKRGKVALGFSSIFWNTAWTQQQPPHTLGILCDPKHPLFADFPTEYHSNWQWWYLISRAGAMILDDLPPTLRPTVQVIDDWFTARKLGLVVEAKLSAGKLLICSVDLESDLAGDPVRRQFRHSLLRYLASNRFAPPHTVTAEQVRALMVPPSTLNRVGVRSFQADSEEAGFEAGQAIDGDPRTFWHTAFRDSQPGYPHQFALRFDHPIRVAGFTVLPRQDGNPNGWIKHYAFYTSMDGRAWGEPPSRGAFTPGDSLKTVKLATPVTARYIRLVALNSHNGQPFAAVAEFDIAEAAP